MTGCTTERHRRVSPPSLIVTTRNRHRRRPRPQAKGPPPCRSRALVPPSATPPPFPPRLSPHGPPSPPGDPRGGVPTQRTRGKPSASTSGPDSPPPPGAVSASTVAASSRSTASRSSASCLTAARDGAGDMASRPMAPGGRVCGTEGAEGGGGGLGWWAGAASTRRRRSVCVSGGCPVEPSARQREGDSAKVETGMRMRTATSIDLTIDVTKKKCSTCSEQLRARLALRHARTALQERAPGTRTVSPHARASDGQKQHEKEEYKKYTAL